MNTIKIFILFLTCSITFGIKVYADGLIVTDNTKYPGFYLKNVSTQVEVIINGLIAETIVTQEFENEWNMTVNGVYSFPLPAGARSTRLLYSVGDTMVDAKLKVQQQSTSPGTGSGGTAAEINDYMGNNVLRLSLTNILPNGNKLVELHYISLLNQYDNIYNYQYPLNTSDFVKTPLDFLKIHITVLSSKKIISASITL